jgi:hypothetical protein
MLTVTLVGLGATLMLMGCQAGAVDTTGGIGLTGFVGLEFAPQQTGDGAPQAAPVAVWLAPQPVTAGTGGQEVSAFPGAIVELRSGGVLIGRTGTSLAGVWEFPLRAESAADLTMLTPTGLFDALAPVRVTSDERVVLSGERHQRWPEVPRRILAEDILSGMSVVIEGATQP